MNVISLLIDTDKQYRCTKNSDDHLQVLNYLQISSLIFVQETEARGFNQLQQDAPIYNNGIDIHTYDWPVWQALEWVGLPT